MVSKEEFDDIVSQSDQVLHAQVADGIKEVPGMAVVLDTSTKEALAIPLDFSKGKQYFFWTVGKLISKESRAEDVVLVVVTEAWSAVLGDKEEFEKHKQSGLSISERPDRIETVVIIADSKDMSAAISYDLERDENENVILVNKREQDGETVNHLAEAFFKAFD